MMEIFNNRILAVQEKCLKYFLILLFITRNGLSKDCTLKDECSCTFDDGSGKVDLTSLGNKDGTARFKDVLYKDEGYYYSYNPCGGFTEGDCTSAAACVSNQDKSEQQQIGDNGKAAFKWDDANKNVLVAYTSGTGVLRLTTVNLICDESACEPTFVPQGEQGAGQFEMTLTTVCACPGGCSSSGPSKCKHKGALSGGSIILIMFFSVVVLYLIGGVLFMKIAKKESGSNLIPNKGLWTSVPGNIVVGVKFTFSKITRRKMEYDQI